MKVPSSDIFSALTWDVSIPDFPTLNARLVIDSITETEIALVGERGMRTSWQAFVKHAETDCSEIGRTTNTALIDAASQIRELCEAYFPNRWQDSDLALLQELHLKLICFYPDGSRHLWYAGSAAFNNLDVDIGVDADWRVTEVRFDG